MTSSPSAPTLVSMAGLRRDLRILKATFGRGQEVDRIATVDLLDWTDAEVAAYDDADQAGQLDLIEARTGHRPVPARHGISFIEARRQLPRPDD